MANLILQVIIQTLNTILTLGDALVQSLNRENINVVKFQRIQKFRSQGS